MESGLCKQQVKPIELYINVSAEEHEVVLSGVKFVDFIENTPIKIENILLLKSEYFAAKNFRGFELLEGYDDISELLREDIYNYGDFSFIDYSDISSINKISEEQIAELLYLAHTHKPLKSAFFDVLQNNFVYLSHDDGWYCKLYCKELQSSTSMLINRLQKSVRSAFCNSEYTLPKSLIESIQNLSTKGLLVSLDFQKRNKGMIKLYEVGKYDNPDILFNSLETKKPSALLEEHLIG